MDKCIACGICAEKCPKKVVDEYDAGLVKRKAAYVKYAQAVPLKYAIDPAYCIYFKKGKCKACEKFCPTGAVNFKEAKKELNINVGSIILSTGSEVYNPATHDVYGYGKSANVLTSLEFERILSSSGPYGGHLVRPSDEKEPQKIAWFQCVGSRDMNRCDNGYCSSVCCMYAVKQTIIAREHSSIPLDCAVFYMDMRTHGKDFDRYYEKAKKDGVKFIRSRVHSIEPVAGTDDLLIRYALENGSLEEGIFDMIVLSTGLEMDEKVIDLQRQIKRVFDPLNILNPGKIFPHRRPGDSPSEAQVVCGGS